MVSSLSTRHSRLASAVFRLKTAGLQLRRSLHNLLVPLPYHRPHPVTLTQLLAESRTPLWTSLELAEKRLQLGKAQNLRLAARHLNGIVIPAGEQFSFWRQVGRATARRGFVAGRELREGCLIPSVGGGLCQLSNALYDAALKAQCQIIERHAHSQLVPGSAAALGRDATVFWNYLDLRFAPTVPMRIEAHLTQDELLLRFWSNQDAYPLAPHPFRRVELLAPTPRGCDSCGEQACDQHNTSASVVARLPLPTETVTAYLLEEPWPELGASVREQMRPQDSVLFPMQSKRYAWDTSGFAKVRTAPLATLRRSRAVRHAKTPPQRRAAQLAGARVLAEALGRQIPPEATHVVVAQTLLPYLWEAGWLGGRSFDVLMTRAPLATLHAQLDHALQCRPEARLLGDFRAPDTLVQAEQAALAAALLLLTPHTGTGALFPEKAVLLPWHLPTVAVPWKPQYPDTIAFAGPTAARKGAFAVREVARELGLTVRLRGSELEGSDFWEGVRTERVETLAEWLDGVACVVQPAIAEDAPRPLLYAIAAGAPVFASPACGITGLPGVHEIPADDTTALLAALEARDRLPARAR